MNAFDLIKDIKTNIVVDSPEGVLINEKLAQLEKKMSEIYRIAADRAYMMAAYHDMLGPNGLAVAKMWRDKGVMRQHTYWGPDAKHLTGEERAAVLLGIDLAPKVEGEQDL